MREKAEHKCIPTVLIAHAELGKGEGHSRENRASDTADLRSAVAALPVLNERKRVLDMHMNIATALLRAIKERDLDEFHGVEASIKNQVGRQVRSGRLRRAHAHILGPMTETPQTPAAIQALLAGKGKADDKMRLFLVYYLSTPDPAEADVLGMEASLKAAGCNMSAVAFIKKCVSPLHRAAPPPID